MSYKEWSTDSEWLEPEGDVNGNLLKSHPKGMPDLIFPNNDIYFSRLIMDLENLGSLINGATIKWWKRWNDTIQLEPDLELAEDDWLLVSIIKKKKQQAQDGDQEIIEIPEQRKTIGVRKKRTFKPMVIGRKQKKEKVDKEWISPPLKVGQMCLIDKPIHHWDGPQTGQVMEISGSKVLIRWFKGGLHGVITPFVLHDEGSRKGKDWKECVNIKQIWCNRFQLTPSQHFPAGIKRAINDYY